MGVRLPPTRWTRSIRVTRTCGSARTRTPTGTATSARPSCSRGQRRTVPPSSSQPTPASTSPPARKIRTVGARCSSPVRGRRSRCQCPKGCSGAPSNTRSIGLGGGRAGEFGLWVVLGQRHPQKVDDGQTEYENGDARENLSTSLHSLRGAVARRRERENEGEGVQGVIEPVPLQLRKSHHERGRGDC